MARRPVPGTAGFGLTAVLLMTLAAGPAAGAGSRDHWPSTRYAPLLARADTLRTAGFGRVYGYLDSLIGAARSRGDADLDMVASIRKASTRGFIDGAFDEAVAESRRWLPRIQAARDTLTWCLALRTIAYADLARQRYSSSLVTYRQMLDLAVRSHLAVSEGYARIGCSYIAIQDGRLAEAERGYAIAIRMLEGRDAFGARTARAGLGNALYSQGRADEARREYERVVADSRAAGDRRNEAEALNDLGAIEFQYGDPSQAAARFAEAARTERALGLTLRALQSSGNVSLCLGAEGRVEEQAALVDSIERAAEAIGATDLFVRCLTDLARIRRAQGRLAEARAALGRATISRDSVTLDTWATAAAERARIELEGGRPEAAARTAKQALDSLGVGGALWNRADLLNALGVARLAAGDAAAAVAPLRECAVLVAQLGGVVGATSITYETSLARAFATLGRRDSALVHYRRAAGTWERLRAAPNDLAWREAFDNLPDELYGPLAAALLDPTRGGTAESRVVEAFATLQRFRSRTLEDLLRGAAGRAQLPRVSLAELQRALRPAEVLLDVFAAPDTTYLFAVTRDGIRVAGTIGGTRLGPRLRRFRDLVAGGEADATTLASAAAALGADLLGPMAEPLRRSGTVLISAGSLTAFPLGMLRVPGEAEPIAVRHRCVIVPSATLLAAARSAREAGPPRSGLVALCRTTDAKGSRLEGVARESRWLARRFPRARVRTNDGTRPLDAMLEGLGSGAVLHIASHTREPSAAPWRAGFLLGSGTGEDAYLTASRISGLRSAARVCVLASCTSVGATKSAEGLPNLASAWLAAGAGTVIATLWKVDDNATARFVEDLYEALARGATTGEAIAAAQHAAMASPDRSAPRFWGGFVLFGDPTTRATLGAAGR